MFLTLKCKLFMLVSVVIPCFNVTSYIDECLVSVYKQSLKHVEVICVDNNSTDGTMVKLQKLKDSLYADLIILSEAEPGASAARNKGLSVAKGEWIQFLDADDLLKEDKIQNQLSLLSNCCTDVAFIIGASIKRSLNSSEEYINIIDNKYLAPFINKSGNTCSNLWSKNYLLEIGGWNTSLKSSQETDLMFRLILKGKNVKYDYSHNTIIRERASGQISQSEPTKRLCQFIEVRLIYLSELKKQYQVKFAENIKEFNSYLISSLIILGKYDIKLATKYFKLIDKKNYFPDGKYGVSKTKGIYIKLFGLNSFLKLSGIFK